MATDQPAAQQDAWIALTAEAVIDPGLPICDAHHHLWRDTGHTGWPYLLEDLHRDTGAGHNVVQTVFLECHAEYRQSGPEHLRSVGEVAFVAESASMDDPAYLQGVRRVGALGYSYDTMVYHPQLLELVDVARACPDTPVIINHLEGTGRSVAGAHRLRDRSIWRRALFV